MAINNIITVTLGVEEFNTGTRFEVQRGEIITGEWFRGYSDKYQMNTFLIVGEKKIAIGIDGNRQDEKMRWKTFSKDNDWNIEPFYNDEFLVEFFI